MSKENAAAPSPGRGQPLRSRARHRRVFRVFQVLVVVVLVAIVTALAYRMLTRPAAVRVGPVVAGTVREEIFGPGTVQSRYSVSIGSRVAGTIDRVLVDVGDEVEEDQLLAELDRTELEARLRVARDAVTSAEHDLALAKANLAKARADLDLARIRDGRAQSLAGSSTISVAEADDARGALRVAEANERAARASVSAREAALARLSQEEHVAETILSYTTIKSPMEGIITCRALEPGSVVAPGAVILQIVDPNALWVATLIDQSLTAGVDVGQRAIIRLRSGAEMGGHVARIAFEADPVTRELEIDVAFDERPRRFAIHEEADVTILGAWAQGLTIPLHAVSWGSDGSSVYVLDNGRAHKRRVEIGILGRKDAEVIEGVSEGEIVILTPEAVSDGQRVVATDGDR